MNQTADIDLIRSILSGNDDAFRTIVDRHKNHVFSIVYRIVGNKEEAEEIAQDVFIKAYNALNKFKAEAKFSTWLYRIAFNSAISATRKRSLEWTSYEDELIPETSDEAQLDDVDALRHEVLPKAIAQLKKDEQTLIGLYYHQNLGIPEISDITSLSESNVKVRLFRARKQLFNLINDLVRHHQFAVL